MNIKRWRTRFYCTVAHGVPRFAAAQFTLLPRWTAATKRALLEHEQNYCCFAAIWCTWKSDKRRGSLAARERSMGGMFGRRDRLCPAFPRHWAPSEALENVNDFELVSLELSASPGSACTHVPAHRRLAQHPRWSRAVVGFALILLSS